MLIDNKVLIGKASEKDIFLLPSKANRHGLITGATGTGKTITLKVMAEAFSKLGIPVFLADVKGDLASLAKIGTDNENVYDRIQELKLSGFEFERFPVKYFDVFGETGHPIRTTISEMGPLLLSRLMNLSTVQEGVLSIVFRIADDNNLLLQDLKDLRSLLQYVGEHASEYTEKYGNIAKASIGAIQRVMLVLEDAGGDVFFGLPSLDIKDFFSVDENGKGYINILDANKLFNSPLIYSTFLLWLLAELFEELPEVGDLDKPKLVFFFDEAHLLFDDAPKALVAKIEQIVKLIRSKGIGVYFISQNPTDIPDSVLAQLSNRVQHALRAYTPNELKIVKAAAKSFRENSEFDTAECITALKTGEALVSFLDEDGIPDIVEKTMICPPSSYMGTIDDSYRMNVVMASEIYGKYEESRDEESAYEVLSDVFEKEQKAKEAEKNLKSRKSTASPIEKAVTTAGGTFIRESSKNAFNSLLGRSNKNRKSVLEKTANSVISSLTTNAGRSITRSIFDIFKK